MSIAQNKKGYWCVKYKTPEGKWKQSQFKEREKAERFEEEMLARLPKQNHPITLGELALAYYQSQEIHPKTQKNVTNFLCGYVDGAPGAGEFLRIKSAEELTRADLETMRNNLRERGCSNATINRYQTYIRAILAWGADQQLIPWNPWRDFKRLPVKTPPVHVSIETLRSIYACSPPWLQWAIKTAFALCLRPGIVELFRLEWSAFDWRRCLVRVCQGKSGLVKTVTAPDAYMQEAWERYQLDAKAGITLVCHRDGHQVTDYSNAWRYACKKAGVKMRPYDIRHLAASEMLAGGADLAAVAAQLGHASVATTGRTYAHVLGDSQKKAAGMLPEL